MYSILGIYENVEDLKKIVHRSGTDNTTSTKRKDNKTIVHKA